MKHGESKQVHDMSIFRKTGILKSEILSWVAIPHYPKQDTFYLNVYDSLPFKILTEIQDTQIASDHFP